MKRKTPYRKCCAEKKYLLFDANADLKNECFDSNFKVLTSGPKREII